MKNWPKTNRATEAAPHGVLPGNDSVRAPGMKQYPQQKLRFMKMRVEFEPLGPVRHYLGNGVNGIGAKPGGDKS